MKALVLPQDYCSKEVLFKEEERLFKKVWNFAGFKSSLKNDKDFRAFKIAGIPLVVQNCKGEIKCFKNICSHRHSLIQTKSSGNGPLLCPYHGWSYNNNGELTGIPKKPLFNFTKEEIECLKLQEYPVAFCGELVFVNIEDNPEPLENWLGELFEEVEKISLNFGELIDVNEMIIKANWKVLVENTLESYHVNLVHENTFKKLGASGMDFEFINPHSVWNAQLQVQENNGKNAKIHLPFQKREYKTDGYKHIMLFPNILISTTYGVSFNLSHITPIDENASKFISYVFITKKENTGDNTETYEKIYQQSLANFNRKVFDEDKQICEEVQSGVKKSHYTGQLSDEEERVCEFQKNYKEYLSQ